MRNSAGVKDRLDAFDAKHGDHVVDGEEWLRFEDGAAREVNPLGLLAEPPADAYETAKRILRYHAIRLQRATDDFAERKHAFIMGAKTNLNQRLCFDPGAEASDVVAELEKLRDDVTAKKKVHDAAEAAVEAAKPDELKQREAADTLNRRRNQAVLDAVNKVDV